MTSFNYALILSTFTAAILLLDVFVIITVVTIISRLPNGIARLYSLWNRMLQIRPRTNSTAILLIY